MIAKHVWGKSFPRRSPRGDARWLPPLVRLVAFKPSTPVVLAGRGVRGGGVGLALHFFVGKVNWQHGLEAQMVSRTLDAHFRTLG